MGDPDATVRIHSGQRERNISKTMILAVEELPEPRRRQYVRDIDEAALGDEYERQLSEERNVMRDTEVEQSGVVPASKTVDSDIANAQDQNGEKSEEERLTTPQTGRLPARASPSQRRLFPTG